MIYMHFLQLKPHQKAISPMIDSLLFLSIFCQSELLQKQEANLFANHCMACWTL